MSNNRLGIHVGVIWPEQPTELETKEARSFLPNRGYTLHHTKPPNYSEHAETGISLDLVRSLVESKQIERAAAGFAYSGLAAISYACTSASYVRGLGGDIDISSRINAVTGAKSSTTSTAMLKGLNCLNVKNVAVLSPHIKPINDLLVDFLESGGVKVCKLTGLGMAEDIDKLDPNAIRSLIVSDVDESEADGVFVSCTSMRLAEVIDDLEKDINKPVITALQATIWDLLTISGWDGFVPDRGLLMNDKRNAERVL